MAELPPLHKIQIWGPTFSSLLERFSSSAGPLEGLLFGHVSPLSPSPLSDDTDTNSHNTLTLIATITSFLSLPSPLSPSTIPSLHTHPNDNNTLIGLFSARRNTPLRPSMRDFSLSSSLFSNTHFSFPLKIQSFPTFQCTPSVFLLLASPINDQTIHTHEYRAFEFRRERERDASFVARSLDIVNIGPAFRGHYGNFSAASPFPAVGCDFRGCCAMSEDKGDGSLREMKRVCEEQRELDRVVDGFDVGGLRRLVGEEAMGYTSSVEDLYEKMLVKIESLARQVELSSAKVLELENHNRKLKYKIMKSPVPE